MSGELVGKSARDPFDCPRCGLNVAPGSGESWATFQMDHCPYCRENGRRFGRGQSALPEPTSDFPTWRPTDG